MFQVRLVGNHLNDFQVKLTMGHLCKIFQVGKVKAEQLKRADGSVEVWSRWQRRLVQAPARGLHSVQSTLMFRFLNLVESIKTSCLFAKLYLYPGFSKNYRQDKITLFSDESLTMDILG